FSHVVRLIGRIWNDGIKCQIFYRRFQILLEIRFLGDEVVRRQIVQQFSDPFKGVLLVSSQVCSSARSFIMLTPAAKGFHVNVFTGDRLDYIWASDEHV